MVFIGLSRDQSIGSICRCLHGTSIVTVYYKCSCILRSRLKRDLHRIDLRNMQYIRGRNTVVILMADLNRNIFAVPAVRVIPKIKRNICKRIIAFSIDHSIESAAPSGILIFIIEFCIQCQILRTPLDHYPIFCRITIKSDNFSFLVHQTQFPTVICQRRCNTAAII